MSRSKAAGTRWETDVVRYLADHGHPHAERRATSGTRDRGDIAGLPGWVVECKAERAMDIAGAIDEARVEAGNAGAAWYAAVVKRRNKPVGCGYVVLDLETFARLLAEDQDGDGS